MNILISGGTSFLGRSLIPKLQKKKCKILLFTTNKGHFKADKLFKKKNLKIIGDNQINYISKFKPDIFLNLQTMYDFNYRLKNISELIDANIKTPLKLLFSSSRTIQRLISPSTYIIYDGSLKKIKPTNFFASLKYSFSIIAETEAKNNNFAYDEVVIFDTFGENDVRVKILNQIKNSYFKNKEIKMSPGKQILDISHIDVISDGFINLIFNKKTNKQLKRTFFASTQNRLTLKKLITKCEKILKKDLNIKWGKLKYRKNVIMHPIKFKQNQNICKKEKLDLRLKNFLINH
jgi:CDP-paratose synthetase